MTWRVDVGDCVKLMEGLEPCSVDAIVTDPPYLLGFMGRDWDTVEQHAAQDWHERWAREALRVLKPGGHLLAFGGTRTYHRLACAIEDAGFEIRDTVAWMYGSGFPKSLDVSKAIDKAAGAEREDVFEDKEGVTTNIAYGVGLGVGLVERRPVTPDAARWNGWGTALKPAHEPVVVARKPLAGTVAANVLEHGTGALNVDGCRIGTTKDVPASPSRTRGASLSGSVDGSLRRETGGEDGHNPNVGRWPANVILDEEAAALLDEQTGSLPGGTPRRTEHGKTGTGVTFIAGREHAGFGDQGGGASRFFYCAKASRAERNAGLEGFEERASGTMEDDRYEWQRERERGRQPRNTTARNHHPTVKPIALMRYLVRLVTPPGGLVLDPFTGSGTTGIAALLEGFRFLGLERDPDYAAIAQARLRFWQEHGDDGLRIVAERERAEAEREAILDTGQLDLLAEPA